jgi:hypothetical protein
VCTGNENSKPIWNKFIIRKDIIETSQVVVNFCRTVCLQIKNQSYFPVFPAVLGNMSISRFFANPDFVPIH